MKGLFLLAAIGVSVGVATAHPKAVQELYDQLYPTDPAKRIALEQCFMADHKFNRLDVDDRERCYRQKLAVARPVVPTPAPPMPHLPQANQVDLWRSAGQGRMPQNDVRFQQQTDRYTHPGGR